MRVIGYTYQADTYCAGCIEAAMGGTTHTADVGTEQALDILAKAWGIDREDERSFDSGDFPKVILSTQLEDDETCAGCLGTL